MKEFKYKWTTIMSYLMFFFMLINFTFFSYRLINTLDTANQEQTTVDGGFLAIIIILMSLSLLCLILYMFNIISGEKNNLNVRAFSISSMVVNGAIAIIYTVYMIHYEITSMTMGSVLFLIYLALSLVTFALQINEILKNTTIVENKQQEDTYDLLNSKIEKLNTMKESGIIDEEQYNKLKSSYLVKFIEDETKDLKQ